ncbi:MAG: amidohydrolase [Lentimicrobium sp.]|nr:amidohydrolase [Lentimicrobium sp.]
MIQRLVFTFLTITVLGACNRDRSMADLIIKNAVIYTADSGFAIYTAMAVQNGKVLDVGDDRFILENYKSDSILDLSGKPVYPGFIDAHCHFYGYAQTKRFADLSGADSFNQMLEKVNEHHAAHPDFWIVGRGWDQNKWNTGFPINEALNKMFPDNPVVLIRVDGHAVLVNEAAIKISGLTPDSISDKKMAIVSKGKFTGVFLESYADLFRNLIPSPEGDQLTKLLLEAADDCFSEGLTMVADAGLDATVIDHMDELQDDRKLKMAIYAMLNPTEDNFERYMKRGILVKPKLIVRSVKFYADGALGSRGGRLIEPYADDPSTSGILTIAPDELGRNCVLAYDNGYQINTHAIGDAAVRMVLDVYSNYLLPGNDLRWRIEHAQVVHKNDFKKFGEFAIIPSIQATHATSDMNWAGKRLGPYRIKNAYAYRKLMLQNNWIPNGTDFPIEGISPVKTFYASVARKNINGYPAKGFQKENALTREEALRSVTFWAAKACFEENRRGSLEPGKNADFVILDKDIMVVPEKEIHRAKVLRTYIDGKAVYTRN